jgi:enoyl-CoA hydratase/carnithine racemase
MEETRIVTEVVEGLGVITLSRPDKRNALDRRTLAEIATAVDALDDRARVVVLRGRGPSFCAGVDVTELGDPESLTEAGIAEAVALGRRAADALRWSRAITIAAIQGHCVGGGVVLAASCDLRIATEDATFRIPEVELGIPLVWGGIPALLRSMPPAVAKELVMTCRPFGAAEADQIGFVNAVAPADRLRERVDDLAHRLLALPPAALTITKAQFRALEVDPVGIDELEAVLAARTGDDRALDAG